MDNHLFPCPTELTPLFVSSSASISPSDVFGRVAYCIAYLSYTTSPLRIVCTLRPFASIYSIAFTRTELSRFTIFGSSSKFFGTYLAFATILGIPLGIFLTSSFICPVDYITRLRTEMVLITPEFAWVNSFDYFLLACITVHTVMLP